MNKKLYKNLGLAILLASSLPFSLVHAETVEEVPTGETTISSMADDPLKEYKEKAANQVSSIEEPTREEPENEPKKENETQTTEDTPTTESSAEDTPDNEPKLKRQPRGGGGITPFSTTLIEGVDIDADFAQLLRTNSNVQNLRTGWSGYGKGQNQLTDDDMAMLTGITIGNRNLSSVKGIEYAINLKNLMLNYLRLSELDVSANTALTSLSCTRNQLSKLDVTKNTALTSLNCAENQLSELDISKNTALTDLDCNYNQLSELDVSVNTALTSLNCYYNQLSELDVSVNTALTSLNCYYNQLSELDVSTNLALTNLICSGNKISDLDVTLNLALTILECSDNPLGELDVSENVLLTKLSCSDNQLTELNLVSNTVLTDLKCNHNQLNDLDVKINTALTRLVCNNNQLSDLDLKSNIALISLVCGRNPLGKLDIALNTLLENLECDNISLTELDITSNTKLISLDCSYNQLNELDTTSNQSLERISCQSNKLKKLDISTNLALTNIYCISNQISDITGANNLSNLTDLIASDQYILIPVPPVSSTGEAVVDVLKTTSSAGLSATNFDISPTPIFNYNGDQILLSNVSPNSLSEKSIQFDYDGSQLSEGAISGNKMFGGTIKFFSVSNLSSELKPEKKRVCSGEKIEWTWIISNQTSIKAENVFANLTLPFGLILDPSSIQKDGSATTINDINGTNNLGDLNRGERLVFTFETTATGNVGDWLKAEGRLDWEDDTIASPYHNETEGTVQIQDDEQTYTPKDTDDMSIQSVPVYFNHGTNPIMSTAQTYHLHSMNYQSNTNVVTDGFYTRIKDDRAISTGWKLTAKLSDFRDSSNTPMPNGTGMSLKLENMSIERVIDRDTPQETIDPSPTGTDVPSSVQSTETIVAGQPTAKTLVTAQPNQGQDTWQLRMPFDKISLNLPANAGKKGTVYKAKLTWSLDDTP